MNLDAKGAAALVVNNHLDVTPCTCVVKQSYMLRELPFRFPSFVRSYDSELRWNLFIC